MHDAVGFEKDHPGSLPRSGYIYFGAFRIGLYSIQLVEDHSCRTICPQPCRGFRRIVFIARRTTHTTLSIEVLLSLRPSFLGLDKANTKTKQDGYLTALVKLPGGGQQLCPARKASKKNCPRSLPCA